LTPLAALTPAVLAQARSSAEGSRSFASDLRG
jgi:hypothetical protein